MESGHITNKRHSKVSNFCSIRFLGNRRRTLLVLLLLCVFSVLVFQNIRLHTKLHPVNCTLALPLTTEEYRNSQQCQTYFHRLVRFKYYNWWHMDSARFTDHSYLTADSTVVEVGSYTGQDAAKLSDMYHCNFVLIEPMPKFYKTLVAKYQGNPKFRLMPFGLGRTNKTLKIQDRTDGTSMFRSAVSESTQSVSISIRNATEFFLELGVSTKLVDLLQINCEGCEYELLELLVEKGMVKFFKHIQFQFHLDLAMIDSQECRYCQLMELLARTHEPFFKYSYIWQCWRLKEAGV